MGMTINTNVAALDAYRNLSRTQSDLNSSLQKLSSGLRINSAADDAAGLSISEGLASQVSGTEVAKNNVQNGINVLQTADGALSQVESILHRMRDLAVQGADDSNSDGSRSAITDEATELGSELYRIYENTNFNGIQLLGEGATADDLTTGTAKSLELQVGTGATSDNQITVTIDDLAATLGAITGYDDPLNPGTAVTTSVSLMNTGDPGVTFGFDVTDSDAARNTIAAVDQAIDDISSQRSTIGASQNRLDSALNLLSVSGENLAAAKSTITDTDMAAEMVNYTRANILSQAGISMLAQANQANQSVLKLLGN